MRVFFSSYFAEERNINARSQIQRIRYSARRKSEYTHREQHTLDLMRVMCELKSKREKEDRRETVGGEKVAGRNGVFITRYQLVPTHPKYPSTSRETASRTLVSARNVRRKRAMRTRCVKT